MHEKVQNSFGFNIVGKTYADQYEGVLANTGLDIPVLRH
jgi:hypothetical protein